MGRTKLENKDKRKTICIMLDDEVFTDLENLKVKNKSLLINKLLKEHFNWSFDFSSNETKIYPH